MKNCVLLCVVVMTLTDQASTIHRNIIRGCQSGTYVVYWTEIPVSQREIYKERSNENIKN